MYIEAVPSRDSRPAFLLRESWSEDGKIRTRTLAYNIAHTSLNSDALASHPLSAGRHGDRGRRRFGLGLFAISGASLAMVGGMPALVSVLLGAVTAISGGAKERASFSMS